MDRTILVNRDNPIPSDYRASIELENVEVEEGFFVCMERETAEKYQHMRHYLSSIGIEVKAISGYRYQETQERIWNKNVADHGEAYARQRVAKPGYSEHQTGLALDLTLYDDQGDMVEDDDVDAYGKLLPHLHKFGFILRYPAGKESVTGYPFEPWHIRYVGIDAAREMYDAGWTLEEYVSRTREELGGRE